MSASGEGVIAAGSQRQKHRYCIPATGGANAIPPRCVLAQSPNCCRPSPLQLKSTPVLPHFQACTTPCRPETRCTPQLIGAVDDCQHNSVSVTYQHPHGDLVGASLADLIATPAETAGPVMTLSEPRCDDCGALLTKRDLKWRIARGGDLHDPRFKFAW